MVRGVNALRHQSSPLLTVLSAAYTTPRLLRTLETRLADIKEGAEEGRGNPPGEEKGKKQRQH